MYQEDFNLPAKVSERTFSPDLDGLIAFIETQPAHDEYCWADGGRCLIAKFAKACGLGRNGSAYNDFASYHRDTWLSLERGVAQLHPRTYGAALKRARALREQHP